MQHHLNCTYSPLNHLFQCIIEYILKNGHFYPTFQISDMPTPLKRVGACQNWSTYVFGPFPVHCEILVELYVANSVSEFDDLTQCATKQADGKGSKWALNFLLLMNVIAGIYSTIAYILVIWEAYIFLPNHDSNDISPLWPLFHVWNYRISGKILIEYSERVWKC